MTRGEAINWIINISADIGKAEHRDLWHYEQALDGIREMLERESERKTGRWIAKPLYLGSDAKVYTCSECKSPFWWDSMNYCPNCGAEMRGEQDE